MSDNFLFIAGIICSGVCVLLILLNFFIYKLKKEKLERVYDEEYGRLNKDTNKSI